MKKVYVPLQNVDNDYYKNKPFYKDLKEKKARSEKRHVAIEVLESEEVYYLSLLTFTQMLKAQLEDRLSDISKRKSDLATYLDITRSRLSNCITDDRPDTFKLQEFIKIAKYLKVEVKVVDNCIFLNK